MNGPDNNGDKPRYELVPVAPLRGVASVLTLGDKKHPDSDWSEGRSFALHYGAAQRHMNAYWSGETHDAEGFHHLAAAAANIMILMDMDLRHSGSDHDDRPDPPPLNCPVRDT